MPRLKPKVGAPLGWVANADFQIDAGALRAKLAKHELSCAKKLFPRLVKDVTRIVAAHASRETALDTSYPTIEGALADAASSHVPQHRRNLEEILDLLKAPQKSATKLIVWFTAGRVEPWWWDLHLLGFSFDADHEAVLAILERLEDGEEPTPQETSELGRFQRAVQAVYYTLEAKDGRGGKTSRGLDATIVELCHVADFYFGGKYEPEARKAGERELSAAEKASFARRIRAEVVEAVLSSAGIQSPQLGRLTRDSWLLRKLLREVGEPCAKCMEAGAAARIQLEDAAPTDEPEEATNEAAAGDAPSPVWLIRRDANGHATTVRLDAFEGIDRARNVTHIRAGGVAPIEVPATDPLLIVRSVEKPYFAPADGDLRDFNTFTKHWQAVKCAARRTEVIVDLVDTGLHQLEIQLIARGRA